MKNLICLFVNFRVGTLGIEGKTPPVPEHTCRITMVDIWRKGNFEHECESVGLLFSSKCTVHGKNGTKAGDGGNGGKQGNPGLAGKTLMFELDRKSNLKIQSNNGRHL